MWRSSSWAGRLDVARAQASLSGSSGRDEMSRRARSRRSVEPGDAGLE
jgi:hypothetical protein